MNTLKVGTLLFVLWVHTGYAQLSCEQKATEVLKFKNEFSELPPDLIDQMITYLAPCADFETDFPDVIDHPKAHYARGLLHLQKGDYFYPYGRRTERSFVHMDRAAQGNYLPAVLDHGINMVTDQYFTLSSPFLVKRNFQKAIDADYKSDIANYVLGYAKLKNFTSYSSSEFTSAQSVLEAKAHFETSNHPMAKHWLAIMHYLGLGTPVDKTKAYQLLQGNAIFNSTSLLQHLQYQANDWHPISAQERLASLENFKTLDKVSDIIKTEVGQITKFEGHLVEYDWTAKGVRRYMPVTLEIEIIEDRSSYKEIAYTLVIDRTTKRGRSKLYPGSSTLNFLGRGSLKLFVNRLLKDHHRNRRLTYLFNSLTLKQTEIDGQPALLIGNYNSRRSSEIKEFKETLSQPIRFILYPQSSAIVESRLETSDKKITISKNFATIAPNPIGDRFSITYTLQQPAEVEVSLFDFYGQQRISLASQKIDTAGVQTINIDSSTLPSGTYLIQMLINGSPYSKTIIKQ